jgi:glycosyltransferase involved in cell wall biosynthesis
MHVALNGWFLDQPHTGSGQYTRRLVEGLLALDDAPRLALVVPQGTPIQAPPDASLVETPLPGAVGRRLGKVWFEQVGFPRACRQLAVDVAHVPYWGGPLRSPVPVVVTIHDLITLLLPDYRGGPLSRLYTALVAASARGAAAVLTDSEASRADIVRHLGIPPQRVQTIYLAAGPDYVPRGGASPVDRAIEKGVREKYGLGRWYVLYLGGFDPRKNLDTLLRAYTWVVDGIGDYFPLALAGRGSERLPGLRAALQRYGLEEGSEVRFIGEVDEADKPALYRGAACFVYPSRYEGFGLPPLEAMACGTPVVAADAASLPEVVGDAAYLVPPGDARQMAAAILAVLVQEDLAEELRRKGLAQAGRFSWRATAQATLDAYRRAAGDPSPGRR